MTDHPFSSPAIPGIKKEKKPCFVINLLSGLLTALFCKILHHCGVGLDRPAVRITGIFKGKAYYQSAETLRHHALVKPVRRLSIFKA